MLPINETLNSSQSKVVIVTSTSVRKHTIKGIYHLQATFATKVYLDLDIVEVTSIKNRQSKKSEILSLNKRTWETFESQMISDKKDINEIMMVIVDVTSKDFYSCIATITKIHKDRGWSYKTCKECMKVAKQNTDGKDFWCINCKQPVDEMGRFKIQFEIQDDSGSTDITAFSEVAESLTGVSFDAATDMINQGNDELALFEMVEENVLGKEYKFNLKISSFNRKNPGSALTVSRVFANEDATKKAKKDEKGKQVEIN